MPLAPNTFEELLEPEGESGVLTYLLTELANKGFPTVAWQTGGVLYTLLRVEARAIADLLTLISRVARGGFLDYAEKGWLTLLAQSAYGLERRPSAFASGEIELTAQAGAGPYTISPGGLWAQTGTGLRYSATNTAPITLPAGPSSVRVPVRAESAGAAYNVGVGTPLALLTPLPGVAAGFYDPGSGTWLLQQGAEEETDESLKARCKARWATIGLEKTRDAYTFLATAAPAQTPPTRVYVDASSPRGPGTVNVWIAGPSGPLSGADETAVRTYVLERASASADVQVENATPVAQSITATIYYRSTFTEAVAQADTAVRALIDSIDLGGTLYASQVIETLMSPDGVVNVTYTGPDVILTAGQVLTPGVITLTGVAL